MQTKSTYVDTNKMQNEMRIENLHSIKQVTVSSVFFFENLIQPNQTSFI